MKAVIYEKYGVPEVLRVAEIEKPIPKTNEILVKIHAATVTSGDVRLRGSDFPGIFWLPARIIFGLFRPKKKILGHEFSGIVESVGQSVSKFAVGDRVFGTTTMLPTGSYAEYICVPEKWKHGVVLPKPDNLRFEESAALPIGGMTALFLLEKAHVTSGKKIMIYGASGSVGSYAVQIANALGASVDAVCGTSNIEMVKSMGADRVIDYRNEDYSESNSKYDVVFDAVGKTSKSKAKKVLKEKGSFVSVNMLTTEKVEHLEKIKQLAEDSLIKPFIDKHYGLDEIVDAHVYVEGGHKKGNVVIDVLGGKV